MKAKALSILLLLILIAPVSITYTWLKAKKHSVKREIKWRMIDGMDKNELVKLSFTHDEATKSLDWEHSREFEYKGEMYDVVDTKTTGDSVHYWCWWDNEETQLNRRLKNLVSIALGLDPEHQENETQLTTLLKLDYFPTPFDWSSSLNELSEKTSTRHIQHIVSRTTSPPSPPPDLV